MKRFLIRTAVVAVVLFSGCETSKPSKPISYRPAQRPKPIVHTKRITYIVDTQPTGAQVYRQVRGGAWVRCQSQTPIQLDLELEMRGASTHIKSINARDRAQYPTVYINSRQLESGIHWTREFSNDELSLYYVLFVKDGYEPFLPRTNSIDKDVHASGLWNLGEYKIVFPLTPIKTGKEMTQTEIPKQSQEGFMLNLRVVGIPSGDVVSTASGVAGSKKDMPDLLGKLCDDLELGWKGQKKSRVSIVGIVEIDTKARENEVGRFATECLYTAVGRRKNLILTERSQISQFLKEHNLTIEDVVDNPKSLEKMIGIDYVILGSVSWTGE